MGIRITKTASDREAVLRVDGQLRAENVAELTREQRSVEGPLVLDLSNLQSADEAGVDVLLELISMGIRIRGASPYIELLLNSNPHGGKGST